MSAVVVAAAAKPADAACARFARAGAVTQGWYPVAQSRRLGRKPRGADIGGRPIVLFRDAAGRAAALDAACAHLGADLRQGQVRDGCLECPFHAWRWDADGGCRAPAGQARRAAAHAVAERWGTVWVWPGGDPAVPLPDPAPGWRCLRLPSQRLRCHPHLVLANGFDPHHFGPLHGFDVERQEGPLVAEGAMTMRYRGTLRPTPSRRLARLHGRATEVSFASVGSSLVVAEVTQPVRFRVLFSARPGAAGDAHTRTFLFVPPGQGFARPLALLLATTGSDRRLLEGLRFHPSLAEGDAALAAWIRLVEETPTW